MSDDHDMCERAIERVEAAAEREIAQLRRERDELAAAVLELKPADACPRCGGLEGTHVRRGCDGVGAADAQDNWVVSLLSHGLVEDAGKLLADQRREAVQTTRKLPPLEHVEDCTTCLTAIHDNDEWRSLEGLLGECRQLLDRLARDAISENLRRVSGNLVRRIDEEIVPSQPDARYLLSGDTDGAQSTVDGA